MGAWWHEWQQPVIAIGLLIVSFFTGGNAREPISKRLRFMLATLATVAYLYVGTLAPVTLIRHLVPPPWAPLVAFVVELVLFSAPAAFIVWWFVDRKAKIVKPEGHTARFLALVAFIVVPIMLVFVSPALIETFASKPLAQVYILIDLTVIVALFLGLWAWSRFWYRPSPEFTAKLQQLRERRDAQARE